MAKVKINKLPKGFELVDGKVKKKAIKRDGGFITGDQADYGLVTTSQEYYGSTNFNDERDTSVRYSLSGVPREDANIEAEGGETVLTDLNGDGRFGLYDIEGPRHNSGGVPMFLPEQSFIFSDTNAMKFDRDEMSEFGIQSRKKKTPADISKKYKLNPFWGAINDQYADDISVLSAELMLKKNMESLSKLAFGQELKKNFEDGVPLAAYPYLVNQGIDPIDFTSQMEEMTRQQAELQFISSLPPDQQDQLLRMQAMMQGIDNPEQSEQPQESFDEQVGLEQIDPAVEMQGELAQDNQDLVATLKAGGELYQAQVGTETEQKTKTESADTTSNDVDQEDSLEKTTQSIENPLPKGHPKYEAFEKAISEGYKIVSKYDPTTRKTTYSAVPDVKRNQFEDFEIFEGQTVDVKGQGSIPVYSGKEEDIIGVYEGYPDNIRVRRGIFSGQDRPKMQSDAGPNSYGADLSTDIAEKDFMVRWGDAAKKVPGFDYQLPKGKWLNGNPLDAEAKTYKKQWAAMQNAMQEVENEFASTHGVKPRILFPDTEKGSGVDGKLGLHTFNRARTYLKVDNRKPIEAEVIDERKGPEPGEFELPKQPQADWWWQDLNNLATQASLENPLLLPVIPQVPDTRIDYVLDDWTGRANMTNAAIKTASDSLRAFGKGRVAGSDVFAKGLNQLAKDVGSVNSNNIRIMNSVALPQAQINLKTGLANAKAYQDTYDKSNIALQRYVDFENWDKVKTNDLYNQAITNRANTYNLNRTKDYVATDPNSGGIINIDYNKPLAPGMTAEEQRKAYEANLIQKKQMLNELGIEDKDNELLNQLIGNAPSGKNKKDQEIDDMINTGQYPPSVRVDSGARKGKETKLPKAFPFFYSGKMGV